MIYGSILSGGNVKYRFTLIQLYYIGTKTSKSLILYYDLLDVEICFYKWLFVDKYEFSENRNFKKNNNQRKNLKVNTNM